MRIGILGSGLMGGKLGTIFARAGHDVKGKRTAATLIHDVGFEPVDAGPLKVGRYAAPFTLLVAQLAYEGKGGPKLGYRFERFGKKGSRPRRH